MFNTPPFLEQSIRLYCRMFYSFASEVHVKECNVVEPLLHFSIPFVASMLLEAKAKKALVLSMFALLPDLDVLFYVHRSFSHSALFILSIGGIAIALFWKTKYREYALLATVGSLSHVMLDLFTNYTPILWPLYNQSMWVVVESQVHMTSLPIPSLTASILTKPVFFKRFEASEASLFSSSGLAISAMLLALFFLRGLKEKLDAKLLWKHSEPKNKSRFSARTDCRRTSVVQLCFKCKAQ